MINQEGLTRLLESYIHGLLEVRAQQGQSTSLDELNELLIKYDVVIEDKQLVSDAYDLITDIRDDYSVVAPVTKVVLRTMEDCMTNMFDDSNAAPNSIQEVVSEKLLDLGVDERTADSVSFAAFSMASDLVAGVGKYK